MDYKLCTTEWLNSESQRHRYAVNAGVKRLTTSVAEPVEVKANCHEILEHLDKVIRMEAEIKRRSSKSKPPTPPGRMPG